MDTGERHLLAVVSSAAVNLCVRVFGGTVFSSLGVYLRVELLGHSMYRYPQPGRGSPEPCHTGTPILGFQHPELRNKFLLQISLLVDGTWLQQTELRQLVLPVFELDLNGIDSTFTFTVWLLSVSFASVPWGEG